MWFQNNKISVDPELTKSEVLQSDRVNTTVCLYCAQKFSGEKFYCVATFSIPPWRNCMKVMRNLRKQKIATRNVSCISLAALE
jgi:hypothetical protein